MISVKKVVLEIDGKDTMVSCDEAQSIVDALTRMFDLERHKPFNAADWAKVQPSITPNPNIWSSTGNTTLVGGATTTTSASSLGAITSGYSNSDIVSQSAQLAIDQGASNLQTFLDSNGN